MSSFTSPLILEYILEKNLWKTDRELVYYVDKEGEGKKIVVPKGFTTDLASVPWPASMIIPKSGRYNSAAVLHDYLYWSKLFSRQKADLIFYQAMRILGVPFIKRWVMYHACRTFAWTSWNRHRAKEK